jgi:hypothetical protein
VGSGHPHEDLQVENGKLVILALAGVVAVI